MIKKREGSIGKFYFQNDELMDRLYDEKCDMCTVKEVKLELGWGNEEEELIPENEENKKLLLRRGICSPPIFFHKPHL